MTDESGVDGVKAYYDRNTRRFLRFGHGRKAAAIHRAVWGPGVAGRQEAMHYVNELILEELERSGPSSILDLGCGVGGTIAYLAARYPARYEGLTLSPVQADIAREILGDDATVRAGDFHNGEDVAGPFDAVYAVESILHASDTDAVLSILARAVPSGGLLLICDDFESPGRREQASRRSRMVARFRRGWHAAGLLDIEDFLSRCRDSGFQAIGNRDLTPYLELGRPRDRVIRAAMALFSWFPIRSPWWSNMLGGDALQTCLRERWIRYHFVTLRRQ